MVVLIKHQCEYGLYKKDVEVQNLQYRHCSNHESKCKVHCIEKNTYKMIKRNFLSRLEGKIHNARK